VESAKIAGIRMDKNAFILAYENALHSQSWDAVSVLMHENITVTFSNAAVYQGKDEVKIAFKKTSN